MKLKEARLKIALSQRELAKVSGITHVTISRIEKHQQVPNFATRRALAKALGISPGELEF